MFTGYLYIILIDKSGHFIKNGGGTYYILVRVIGQIKYFLILRR